MQNLKWYPSVKKIEGKSNNYLKRIICITEKMIFFNIIQLKSTIVWRSTYWLHLPFSSTDILICFHRNTESEQLTGLKHENQTQIGISKLNKLINIKTVKLKMPIW